jgi:hypothetical protein
MSKYKFILHVSVDNLLSLKKNNYNACVTPSCYETGKGWYSSLGFGRGDNNTVYLPM